MHLSLESFNRLTRQSVSQEERAQIVDHLLACDACAQRLRALNALEHESKALFPAKQTATRRRVPLRYILGVAAILIMSITPYLTRSPQRTHTIAWSEPAPAPHQLALLAGVKKVNYQAAVQNWNKTTNLIDLVRQTGDRFSP